MILFLFLPPDQCCDRFGLGRVVQPAKKVVIQVTVVTHRQKSSAGGSIGDVVMGAAGVIDTVVATACDLALETNDLVE